MAAKETLERELKLAAPDGFELPDLGGEPLEPRTFTSTYYDTSDHRLARAGITLRRRVEHGKGLWQLKLPEGNARRELEHPGGSAGPPRQLARLLVAPVEVRVRVDHAAGEGSSTRGKSGAAGSMPSTASVRPYATRSKVRSPGCPSASRMRLDVSGT